MICCLAILIFVILILMHLPKMHQNYELFVISLPLGDLTPTTKEVLEFLKKKAFYN